MTQSYRGSELCQPVAFHLFVVQQCWRLFFFMKGGTRMTNVMKQKLMLSFVSLTLLVAFAGFLMMNQSLAWFSKNKVVTANGLTVSAKGTVNLIIGETVEDIQRGKMQFSVNFKGKERTDMIAVTRDPSVEDTFLKYLINHHAVDNQSGLKKEGAEDLIFAPVPEEEDGLYYIDYVVYIAATLDALEVSSLEASIVSPTSLDAGHAYLNAASIDFYFGTVSEDGYRGTISVADSLKSGKKIDLFEGNGGTIPLNTSGEYITVIMRCYFDGALTSDANRAYVNSYNVLTDGIAIGVHFAATEVVEEE